MRIVRVVSTAAAALSIFVSAASFGQLNENACDPPKRVIKCEQLAEQAQNEGLPPDQLQAALDLCGVAVKTNVALFHFRSLSPARLKHLSALDLNEWATAELSRQACFTPAQEKLDLALQRVGDDRLCKAVIENNIGTVAFLQKAYPTALEHYNKALSLLQEVQAVTPPPKRESPTFDPAAGLLSCYTNDFHESDLHARIGATYIRQGGPGALDRAMREYEEIAKLPGNRTETKEAVNLLADIARAQFAAHNYANARDAARRLLSTAGLSPDDQLAAHRILGGAAQEEGNHREAIEHFQAALAVTGASADARSEMYRWMAASQAAMGDIDAAAASYTQAANDATEDSKKAAAIFGRGRIYAGGNDDNRRKAVEDFRAARALAPKNDELQASTLSYEANTQFELKSYADAAARYAELEQILAKASINPYPDVVSLRDVRVSLAGAEREAGQKQAAIEALTRALTTSGKTSDREIYQRRGSLYFESGDKAKSTADFELASGLKAGTTAYEREVHAILGKNYIDGKQWTRAAEESDQALAMGYQPTTEDKEHGEVLRNSAYAYFQQKNYQRAIERYASLTTLDGDQKYVEIHGGLYQMLTPPDDEGARRVYETLKDPNTRYKRVAGIYMTHVRNEFCSDHFNDAATWLGKVAEVAKDAGLEEKHAVALKQIADMHFDQRLMELHNAGRVRKPKTDTDREPLLAVDREYEQALAAPALPSADRADAMLRRGDLAYLAYDWDTAQRWYGDALLKDNTAAQQKLDAIAKLKAANEVKEMTGPVTYADRAKCQAEK